VAENGEKYEQCAIYACKFANKILKCHQLQATSMPTPLQDTNGGSAPKLADRLTFPSA